MAQIIHNISTPNDGLGDALRTAMGHQNDMNTELYTDKVDKVTGKGLSTNDYTNAEKSKLAGIEVGAQVNVQSDWEQADVDADDYIKNKPEQLFASVGYFDYNDLATQTTPLAFTSGVELQLTNDTLGAFTDVSKAPYGISILWDSATNTFDFSQFESGDTIDLRVDLNISTIGANAVVKCFLRLGEGTASEYDVFIGDRYFKSAATFENTKMDLSFYIGSDDVRLTPAKIIFIADAIGEVKVNGWYTRVIRRNVNIVSFAGGDEYVKKQFYNFYSYPNTGVAQVLPFRPDGIGNYSLTNGALVSLAGFDLTLITGIPTAEPLYLGKQIIIDNKTGGNVTLQDGGVAEIPFDLGVDVIIPANGKILFYYNGITLTELFRSWTTGGTVSDDTFTLSFPRLAISGNATNVFFASFINTSSVLFNSSTAIADHTLLTSINFGITRLFTIPQDCIIDKITCSLNVAFELSIWKADSLASPTTGKTEVFYETSIGSGIANYNVASPTLSQGNIIVPMIKTLGGTTTYFGDFFITFKTI